MEDGELIETIRVGKELYRKLPDGTLTPLKGASDWTRVDGMSDAEIEADASSDSDALALSDDDWANVKRVDPFKTPITIPLDTDVVDWFKTQGSRYQSKINAVLRHYVETQKKAG